MITGIKARNVVFSFLNRKANAPVLYTDLNEVLADITGTFENIQPGFKTNLDSFYKKLESISSQELAAMIKPYQRGPELWTILKPYHPEILSSHGARTLSLQPSL